VVKSLAGYLDKSTPSAKICIAAEHRLRSPTTLHAALFFGESKVSQETITQILAIEEQAVQIHDGAQRQADRVTAEAKKTVTAVREQTLAHMRQQAEQITAEGQHAAEVSRARIIAQAEAEAQHLENVAAQHLDQAVSFVLDHIAGRE
jgi:vacuolar-type H+-ATPase subunit H